MTEKKGINWYKIIVYAVIVFFIAALIRNCGKKGDFFGCNRGQDTISYTKDSIITLTKDSIVYVPMPYAVIKEVEKWRYRDRIDTILHDIDPISPTDTAALLADYNSIRLYADTLRPEGAVIRKYDTVSHNRIVGSGVRVDIETKTITETITVEAPPKTIWYWGLSAMGAKTDPFFAAGMDLSVKFPSDKMIGFGANLNNKGTVYYEAQLKLPIRLGKKR